MVEFVPLESERRKKNGSTLMNLTTERYSESKSRENGGFSGWRINKRESIR